MVISRFNATKAYKRKRGASPPRIISLPYWATQVMLRIWFHFL
jgi:hypothetical protein